MGAPSDEFDVAVSFAGEDRPTVDRFVSLLKAAGLKVFYDTAEQGKLWGRDLYEYLDDVYKHQARFCVMFISEHYARKRWTTHERKSAQERAFKENREYILPVRFDDTVIPGMRDTVGYLDLRSMSIEQVAALAIEKVGEQNVPDRPAGNSHPGGLVIDSSSDWVLLGGNFYRALSTERPHDERFVVTIVSQDAATDSQMEAIRAHRNSGTRGLEFAYASDAYVVHCESATSVYEGGAHRWKITLVKENLEYGGSHMDMGYSDGARHYSAEDFARMRAERILLNKHAPPPPAQSRTNDVSAMMLESFIQGSNSVKVTESPIFRLAGSMNRNDVLQFMQFARLAALFYLKAGGVVERIERLTLGPMQQDALHVVFRGVRRKKYSNADPEVIQVKGDCPLP